MTACGFPLGASLGGALVATLIANYGWRSVFIAGGFLSLLLVPFVIAWLPESIPLLLKRTHESAQAQVRKQLHRMFPKASLECEIVWSGTPFRRKQPLVALFQQGPALFFVLAAAFFMSLLVVYLLSNWLPALLQQAHSTAQEAALATAGFNLGGIAGGVLLGRLMDRFGFIKSLAVGFVFGAASIVLLAVNHFSFYPLALAAFASGFIVIGCQGGLNAVPSLLYPDDLRSTATGCFGSIGRVGSILGPLIAGFLLTAHWNSSQVLLFTAIPALCASTFLFGMFGLKLKDKTEDCEVRRSAAKAF